MIYQNFVEFRRYWRNKTTGETNTQLWQLLKPGMEITFNKNYHGADTCKDSPFLEFETVDPKDTQTEATTEALTLKRGHKNVSFDVAIDLSISMIEHVLQEHWEPDKFHILLASSGYDSRILLALIKKLNLPGDYLAITNRWESETFLRIIDAINESRTLIYAEGKPENHFDCLLDFQNQYKHVNAPCAIPANQWYYLVDYAQSFNFAPKDNIQMLGGYWHNEIVSCFVECFGGESLRPRYLAWYPYHVMASLPQNADSVLFPFTHIDYIKLINSFGFRLPEKAFRKAMADRLIPSLSDIPASPLSDLAHRISDQTMLKAKQLYIKSWFGSHVRPDSVKTKCNTSDFSTFWTDYSLASLCEYARSIGVTIYSSYMVISEICVSSESTPVIVKRAIPPSLLNRRKKQ